MSLIIASQSKENGAVAIYTVPSNKYFMLVSAHLVLVNGSADLASAEARIYDDAPANIDCFMLLVGPPGANLHDSMTFNPPVVLPEDYSVRVYGSTEFCRGYLSIMGYEV